MDKRCTRRYISYIGRRTNLFTTPPKAMNYNYKELQNALKNLKNAGYDVQVKLNSKLEILKAEYDRLTTVPESLRAPETITAQEFNEMVGFPTEALVSSYFGKATLEPLEPIQTKTLVILPVNLPSDDLEQLETIQVIGLAISNSPSFPKPTQGYWIDGSEISSHLESTQQQAIRNLQDGWRSLKNFGRNLKSFKTGFDEGLRLAEAAKASKSVLKNSKDTEKSKVSPKPPESALKPSKIPKKAKRLSTAQRLPRAA